MQASPSAKKSKYSKEPTMPVRIYVPATFAIILSFLVFGSRAYACDFPSPVSIPDGKTATKAEMTAAGRAMLQYFRQYETYVTCVESETSAQRKLADDTDIFTNRFREELAASRINDASAAVEKLAERFNEATAEFEARSEQ
jgi:hypothetical protein